MHDYSSDTVDYSKKMMESTSWDEFNHWAAQRTNKANAQGIDISGSTWKSNDQIKSEWVSSGNAPKTTTTKKPAASSTSTVKKSSSSSLNGSSEHPSKRGKTFDSGGIASGGVGLLDKETEGDEIVLSPELTRKILAPSTNAEFRKFTQALGMMFGPAKIAEPRPAEIVHSSEQHDRHDRNYYINGVQIGEQEAQKPLSEILSTLALYANS